MLRMRFILSASIYLFVFTLALLGCLRVLFGLVIYQFYDVLKEVSINDIAITLWSGLRFDARISASVALIYALLALVLWGQKIFLKKQLFGGGGDFKGVWRGYCFSMCSCWHGRYCFLYSFWRCI